MKTTLPIETRYAVGDQVRGSVQGMNPHKVYTVRAVVQRHTPFGTFVTYYLDGDTPGTMKAIGNGHLVLEPAGGAK